MTTTGNKEPTAFIRDLKIVTEAAGLQRYTKELTGLQRFASSPLFRLSILGRPFVNKAACINRLLGRPLLPTDLLSMKNTRTFIQAGEGKLVLEWEDGSSSDIRPDDMDWAALRDQHPVKAWFHLQDEWLKSSRMLLAIYDNMDDPDTRPADAAEDMAFCDAAVLIVDATAPLGMVEMETLEHLLAREHTPRLAVIATKLDLVSAGERERMVGYIHDRLRSLPGEIILFILDEDPANKSAYPEDIYPIEEMRHLLEKWVDSDARAVLKEKAIIAHMLLLIDRIETALILKRLDLAKNSAGKKEQLLKMRHRLEQKRLIWKGIRIAMEKRSIDCSIWWKSVWDQQMASVGTRLRHELSLSKNPKEWWEKELSFRLKTELDNFSKGIERPLESRVLADIGWAINQVREEFSRSFSSGSPKDLMEAPAPVISVGDKQLSDITRSRDILKLVTGAAAVAGYFLFGPAGILVTVTGGILNDRIMAARISEQSQGLSDGLGSMVTTLFNRIMDATAGNIRDFYNGVLTEIRKQEGGWVREQEALLFQHENLQDPELEAIIGLIGSLETIKSIL